MLEWASTRDAVSRNPDLPGSDLTLDGVRRGVNCISGGPIRAWAEKATRPEASGRTMLRRGGRKGPDGADARECCTGAGVTPKARITTGQRHAFDKTEPAPHPLG